MSRPAEQGDARIEYVAIDDVSPAERNPKWHDDDSILASIRRFGFTAPLIVDERTGRLVAGHGRLRALRRLRDDAAPAPARVRVDDGGRWMVPVLRGVAFKSKREAEAYLLADNQLVSAGGWDEDVLGAMLRELRAEDALDGLGFSDVELRQILDGGTPHGDTSGKLLDDSTSMVDCPKCGHRFSP